MFAYDKVWVDKTREEISFKIDKWKETLEFKDLELVEEKQNIWFVTLAKWWEAMNAHTHCVLTRQAWYQLLIQQWGYDNNCYACPRPWSMLRNRDNM